MRQMILALVFSILLAGCAASGPDVPIETTLSPTSETTIPTTEATEPPDPMAMLLAAMTVEEKVGQLFLARCPDAGAEEDIAAYALGGYILFGRDFDSETRFSFQTKIESFQSLSPIPLLIAVDEEGGTVPRSSAAC